MKSYNYLTLFCALSFSTLVYSQKLEKLSEITEKDFLTTNFLSQTILTNKTLVTFPYIGQGGIAGALDKYFTLRVESIVRIAINNSDSVKKLFCLSKEFDGGLQIKSVKYYYKKGITTAIRKIKESDLGTSIGDSGFYIDYSKVIQDSSAIIEINYRSDSKSKNVLQFFLDNSFNYKDFGLQVYIPEIYTYNVSKLNQCIGLETKKDLRGASIGYYQSSGPHDELVPKAIVDLMVKNYNAKYDEVYCRNNLLIFKMNGDCSGTNNRLEELISLKLQRVDEIK